MMNLSSQISFLYFQDLEAARTFFSEVLELEIAYDPGWAVVYRVTGGAFLGAVDAQDGSIEVKNRGGVLISLTVGNIEDVHRQLKAKGLEISDIKKVKEIELESFFFKGPEGYDFEIQQFKSPELRDLF